MGKWKDQPPDPIIMFSESGSSYPQSVMSVFLQLGIQDERVAIALWLRSSVIPFYRTTQVICIIFFFSHFLSFSHLANQAMPKCPHRYGSTQKIELCFSLKLTNNRLIQKNLLFLRMSVKKNSESAEQDRLKLCKPRLLQTLL